MRCRPLVIAALALPLMPVTAYAQEQVAGTVEPRLTFFDCVHPSGTARCRALNEHEKRTTCADCSEWVEHAWRRSMSYSFGAEDYLFARAGGVPTANLFLRDAARQLYDVEFPATSSGYPIRSHELYESHDSLGWSELAAESSKAGSLAVWRGGGGLVIGDSGDGITVLYPSARRGGALAEVLLRHLVDPGDARFLVPREWVMRFPPPARDPR